MPAPSLPGGFPATLIVNGFTYHWSGTTFPVALGYYLNTVGSTTKKLIPSNYFTAQFGAHQPPAAVTSCGWALQYVDSQARGVAAGIDLSTSDQINGTIIIRSALYPIYPTTSVTGVDPAAIEHLFVT